MKPGRELDALVAEKVMGWTSHDFEPVTCQDDYDQPPEERMICKRCCWSEDDDAPEVCVKEFSTDIRAAWEVWHFLSKLNGPYGGVMFYKPVLRLEYYEHDECVEVRIGRCKEIGCDNDVVVSETGITIPHAICLAALQVVGVDIQARAE